VDLPARTPYLLKPALPIAGPPILLRHPVVITNTTWYRNIDLFPIDYALRPRLRGRLTLSGRTFLKETLDLRRVRFSRTLSLLVPAESLLNGPPVLTVRLHSIENALLPPRVSRRTPEIRSFGTMLEPRYIVGTEPLDQ
jgi:hypothetical protein